MNLHRAYALIEIKSVKKAKRVLSGIASTPEPDRSGDIVEPLGLFARDNETILLWQHKADHPIGRCTFDAPTARGIRFTAHIPEVDEPGPFKDMTDLAWQAVLSRTVRAVSIGFVPIEFEPLPNGAIRYRRAELVELSIVSVPMHQDATIDVVRAIDRSVVEGCGSVAGVAPLKGGLGPVVTAVMRAIHGVDVKALDAESLAEVKAEGMPLFVLREGFVAGSHETDAQLTALRARLDRLEQRNG